MANSNTEGSIPHSEKPCGLAKATSSVRETFDVPSFGSRYLTKDQDVFSQNAWDHVPLPTDQEAIVAEALARQRSAPIPECDRSKYNTRPARHWDLFYKHNTNNFFRDRNWLHLEFPELVATTQAEAGPITILEVGCGAGNAVFPLLSTNKNPELKIVACDYSPRAVQLVKSHALYDSPPAGNITASLWDLTSDSLPEGLTSESVDFVVMIFVLSALHPEEWRRAIANVHALLKPGGRVVLRDYGRYDLAQLRFKEGRLLGDNFYIRGDKTRVYFFTVDELATIFTGEPSRDSPQMTTNTVVETESPFGTPGEASPNSLDISRSATGSPPIDLDTGLSEAAAGTVVGIPTSGDTPDISSLSMLEPLPPPFPATDPPMSSTDEGSQRSLTPYLQHPLFSIQQLGVDNRLLVNRKRQLKMHRVWMQGKFIKLPSKTPGGHIP